ncbi:MAG TPA: hypothetical protein VGR67_02850 [Candidatus Polarisedimenticolia bacterium]|jgi:hypothetical protein|nr:hypothetical protein [Candidatus Polarisedimenticolia bacterium]
MRLQSIAIALLLLLTPLHALAWTDSARRRMVDDAMKMTPPALNAILERYRSDLIHGMLDPSRDEMGEEHRQRSSGEYGKAASLLAARAGQAVTIIGQPGRLSLAVYAMGSAAHYVADVDFPLNAGGGGGRDPIFYASYDRYVEKMLGRFPIVLDRKPLPELVDYRLEDFGKAAALRASHFIEPIRNAYTPDGRPRSASAFDDRSLPFGVASLSFSQSVNDIARVWTSIWQQAGGDVGGLPFPASPGETGKKTSKVKKRAKSASKAGAAERPR